MHSQDISLVLLLLSIPLTAILAGAALGQNDEDDSAILNQLVLNVYIDEGGRALVNGYIDDPGSLAFLNSSEYTYDEDSRQLYAITSSLTSKIKDNWILNFESDGSHGECQIMFYLPANAKLKGIDCSMGLENLIYVADDRDSVIVEVQGHDITDPAVDIEYILQLSKVPAAESGITTGNATVTGDDVRYPYKAIALVMLLAIGLSILIFFLRSRSIPKMPAEHMDILHEPKASGAARSDSSPPAGNANADPLAVVLNKDAKGSSKISELVSESETDENQKAGIMQTREILAVMETLTDKEQAIVKALLRRGGTMTQTEIRYETDISKSSLSGILTALEKRKLITKQEKGRTNVIELSELFLNSQERS